MRLLVYVDSLDDVKRMSKAFSVVGVYDEWWGRWNVYVYEPYKLFWVLSRVYDAVTNAASTADGRSFIAGAFTVKLPEKNEVRHYASFLARKLSSLGELKYTFNEDTYELEITASKSSGIWPYTIQFLEMAERDLVDLIAEGFGYDLP